MKIKKVWAIFLTVIALSLCACGPNTDKTDKTEQIYKAAADIVEFLNCVKESGNYSSVSEYDDGSKYYYYTVDGKIKVEYNDEVFYGLADGELYKIYQAEDLSWHKTTKADNLTDPVKKVEKLISSIDNTSRYRLWNDYDSATKTLTSTFTDGHTTVKLDAGELSITFVTATSTTSHTINRVGETSVTLPDNIIIDD